MFHIMSRLPTTSFGLPKSTQTRLLSELEKPIRMIGKTYQTGIGHFHNGLLRLGKDTNHDDEMDMW